MRCFLGLEDEIHYFKHALPMAVAILGVLGSGPLLDKSQSANQVKVTLSWQIDENPEISTRAVLLIVASQYKVH